MFVELPEIGKMLERGAEAAVIESVKAASEVYAPASGKVTEVNAKLAGEPALVNQSPYEKGWLYKLDVANPKELDALMDAGTYDKRKTKAH